MMFSLLLVPSHRAYADDNKITITGTVADIKANPLTAHVPVILSGHDNSADSIINALDNGADDYVAKPFSMRELLARIYAVCRRHPAGG